MSLALEEALAKLYTNNALLEAFFADSDRVVNELPNLSVHDRKALLAIDRIGLRLAAQSYARKRHSK
jgi:hypothetical protein